MALGKTIREFGVKVSLLFDKSKVTEAKKSIDGIASSMKLIGLEVGGAMSTILGFTGAAGANARALDLNSKQLGINVERLQELEYAAKVAAGVSRDELTGALEGVSKTLFDARNNNVEAARTLIRLGVPLEMITNKSITADQVLLNLSDRFQQMPDGMMKTALANEAFGASGAKLLPLLNKGAKGIAAMGKEARDLDVILKEETIKQGAKFVEQFNKVWIVLKNITFTIGNQLIKYLMPLVQEFLKLIAANKKFISLGIGTVVKNIAVYLKLVFFAVKLVVGAFRGLIQTLGGLEKVSRVVALAMGVFTGVRILNNVMALVGAFRTLIFAIVPISGPIGIAIAAFTALYFIVKDLFSSDSVIKKWIGNFKKTLPEIVDAFSKEFPQITALLEDVVDEFQDKFPNLAKLFAGVFDIVPVGLSKMLEFLNLIISKTEELGDKFGVFKKIGDIGDWLAQKTGQFGDFLSSKAKDLNTPVQGAVQSAKSNILPSVKQGVEAAKTTLPIAKQAVQTSKAIAPTVQEPAQYVERKSIAESNTTNVKHGDTQMNATIHVTVPRGTEAKEATEIVSGGVEKGFHAILRQTRDQFLGGVAQ